MKLNEYNHIDCWSRHKKFLSNLDKHKQILSIDSLAKKEINPKVVGLWNNVYINSRLTSVITLDLFINPEIITQENEKFILSVDGKIHINYNKTREEPLNPQWVIPEDIYQVELHSPNELCSFNKKSENRIIKLFPQ